MIDFSALKDETRLLIEAELKPLQGTRFQPTGFPDLGAATYDLLQPAKKKEEAEEVDKEPPTIVPMVLLESPQSIANRLETVIWDEANEAIIQPLEGISYVVVEQNGDGVLTNSLLEAHRLNSPYILGPSKKLTTFGEQLKTEMQFSEARPLDFHNLATVVARYDINCLLHGVFLEKLAGVARLTRALSGFIEAYNVRKVDAGGMKWDRVDPTGKAQNRGGAGEGYGNVPYHREEFTAEKITAYFSLDLAQIRGYRLSSEVEDLLIAIAVWKIQRFLNTGLRLRTACDLDCIGYSVTRPKQGFELPDHDELTEALPKLVKAVADAGWFANPPVTVVQYEA